MRIYIISGEKGTGKTTLAKGLTAGSSRYIMVGSESAYKVLDMVSTTDASTITLDLINPHDKGMLRLIYDIMMGHGFVSPSVKLLIVIFEVIPYDFINLPYVNYIQLVQDRYCKTAEELLALWKNASF